MKIFKKSLCYFTIFSLLTLSLVGCSTKSISNIVSSKNTLDFGTFNGNNYTQSYFGLSLTTPKNWSVMDDDTRNSLYNKTIESFSKNAATKKKYDLSKEKDLIMFLVSQAPYSQGKSAGSNIIFQTENLGLAGNILSKTGKDYIEYSKKSMTKSSNNFTFGDTKKEKIGNKDFYSLTISSPSLNNVSRSQKMYCTVQKGYALIFFLTYTGDKTADAALDSIMSTVKFK